mgnify:CR=1 FL=1
MQTRPPFGLRSSQHMGRKGRSMHDLGVTYYQKQVPFMFPYPRCGHGYHVITVRDVRVKMIKDSSECIA